MIHANHIPPPPRPPFVVYLSPRQNTLHANSTVQDSSVVSVQIFDQHKFKRKDQGFLGVINVKVSDVLDLELGGHGESIFSILACWFLAVPFL
jgi:hypothetical protein